MMTTRSSDSTAATLPRVALRKQNSTTGGMLRRFAAFLTFFQSILFLSHYLLFLILVSAFVPSASAIRILGIALAFLSLTFLGASLLGFRYTNFLVRLFYTPSAIWLRSEERRVGKECRSRWSP